MHAWQVLRERGLSARQAAQELGPSRATLYRWQKRLHEGGLAGLEEDSRRPQRVHQRSWDWRLSETV